ncbi:DNA-binding response regulator [Corticibacter populi]|uniref:DNA-binding response regulator n=1 Tax=Corticibacter populi TaxID=1550736 RepID=A0A3M6QPR3_9BURK|nr:response regulator transcription factor [Corticibacter populi]RMX05015.1 DNA-binding response regulator [Corticibacter populi]RZS33553.1 LuxR family two component transcriptional regulator [Corticibacter populi]
MPTLLIADDHPLFREALRATLARLLPDVVVHEAEHVEGLYALVEAYPDADLLLLDLSMPGGSGFDPLARLRTRHPQLPVAVVSAHEDVQSMRRAMDHGAFGFIPKSSDVATLAAALQCILDGEPWFPPAAMQGAATSEEEQRIAARIGELTPQQAKVLQMVAAGRLNKQIAHELGISEATIKAHMTAILRKLGASNRTQAVAIVNRLGLR